METELKRLAEEFLKIPEDTKIRVISHHDTDGITSAAILTKTLQRLNRPFTVKIVKGLDKEILKQELKRNNKEILFFTDLASSSLDQFRKLKQPIFVIDHHEISIDKIPENVFISNPHLFKKENLCGAALTYLFSKAISPKNKDLAKLAIIGMIGDRHEAELTKSYQKIVSEVPELEIIKSLMIFSSTRPLRRSLEYSTSFYIPGVTGSSVGVLELLRETSISPEKTLSELNEKEVSSLITAIMLKRTSQRNPEEIIGNIYLMKFFNRREDVRELSVLINACSKLGHYGVALAFCLQNESAKEKAQEIYIKYKQELITALRAAENIEKIQGNGFVILNAKEKIKDAVIGTVCSMLSSSKVYDQGTVLIGMAYNENKIKVSARITGQSEKNLKRVLEKTVMNLEAEVGGHQKAAGCLINKEDEKKFLEELRKNLEIEVVKISNQ